LLGGFRVELDGTPVPAGAWRHRRATELVKLLALAPGHSLHREQVMDALWPDLSPAAASANLRKALHYARKALGEERSVGVAGTMLHLWP
jgi:DNA-binding SARP family transcriptional activator